MTARIATITLLAFAAFTAPLEAYEAVAEEVETTYLEPKQVAEQFSSWVEKLVPAGGRKFTLMGDRDKVQQAIGAIRLADEQARRSQRQQSNQRASRMFRITHADPRALEQILRQFGPSTKWDDTLEVLVVSGNQRDVTAAAAALEELDVPKQATPRGVSFDVHMVGGFQAETEASEMPATVRAAVDSIRKTFPYRSYKLLETLTLQTLRGESARVQGHLESSDEARPIEYEFFVDLLDRSDATSVELKEIRLQFTTRDQNRQPEGSTIQTRLSAHDGKTIVVGKAGIRGVADGVFLVLTTRFE